MTVFTELRKRQILQDKVHGTLAEKSVFTSYCIDKLKYERRDITSRDTQYTLNVLTSSDKSSHNTFYSMKLR